MTDNNKPVLGCFVSEALMILQEEEEKIKPEDIDAAIIRTCISLILRELEHTTAE